MPSGASRLLFLAVVLCGLASHPAWAKGGSSGSGSSSKGGSTDNTAQDNNENEKKEDKKEKIMHAVITSAAHPSKATTLEEVQAEKARTQRRLMELEAQEEALKNPSRSRQAETSDVTVGVTNSADWSKKFFGDDYKDHEAVRCACIAYGDNGAFCMGWECRDKTACFPGDSKVELQNGTMGTIADLREGDVVRGSTGWTPVTIISHQVAASADNLWFDMKAKVFQGGRTIASHASPEHHVFVVKRHVGADSAPRHNCQAHLSDPNTFYSTQMKNVRVGDRVCTAEGLAEVVENEPASGEKVLIAPHTMDGTIQVDETLYSCYSHPTLSHHHSHILFNYLVDPLRKTLLPYRDDGKDPHSAKIEGMVEHIFTF